MIERLSTPTYLWLVLLCAFSETRLMMTDNAKTTITVFRIAGDIEPDTKSVQDAQQYAITRINADDTLLKDYELKLKVLNSGNSDEKALEHAITMSVCNGSVSSIVSPIVLGCPFSAFSVLTSKVFNIFHLLQVSATATGSDLSNKNNYKSFFRTVADDRVMALRLVRFCKQNGWTRVGVVYQDDAWGRDLDTAIEEEAEREGVTVHSTRIVLNDEDSIGKAVEFIKQEDPLYVSILAMLGPDVSYFLKTGEFDDSYFFFGTDGWFNTGQIELYELATAAKGTLGLLPFYPAMLTLDEYLAYNTFDGNATVYDESTRIYNEVYRHLLSIRNDSSSPITTTVMGYAYDAVYALAHALDIYAKTHSVALRDALSDCEQRESIAAALRQILMEMPPFFGCTGLVKFDANGDRVNSSFVFGQLMENGTIQIVTDLNVFGSQICGTLGEKCLSLPNRNGITITPTIAILIASGAFLTAGILTIFVLFIWKRIGKKHQDEPEQADAAEVGHEELASLQGTRRGSDEDVMRSTSSQEPHDTASLSDPWKYHVESITPAIDIITQGSISDTREKQMEHENNQAGVVNV